MKKKYYRVDVAFECYDYFYCDSVDKMLKTIRWLYEEEEVGEVNIEVEYLTEKQAYRKGEVVK